MGKTMYYPTTYRHLNTKNLSKNHCNITKVNPINRFIKLQDPLVKTIGLHLKDTDISLI